MSDWPQMKPVKHQHEKENAYLTLVDMFVDVVEPAIIQMVLQNRNWDLDTALEDIITLASTSQADKTRLNRNKSVSGLENIKISYTDNVGEKNTSNGISRDKHLPVNLATPLTEQQNLCDQMSLNSKKRNMKKPKPQLSVTNPRLITTSGAMPSAQKNILLPFLEQYNYVKAIPVPYDRTVMLIRDGVKLMVILRGPPGSGKSHLARKLLNDANISLSEHKRHIFSSDNFFVQNNTYIFVPDLLSQAHMWNQRNVATALREQVSPIIVDNTNTQAWEMKAYAEMAVSTGYDLEILEPETWWAFKERELAKKNIHNVPKAKIRNMIERYEKGITPELLLRNFNLRYSLTNAPPQQVLKSKWKDKLFCQTNNKPKKKKSDFIPKINTYKNFNNDNLPSSFPFAPLNGQTSSLQHPFTYSEKELKKGCDSIDGKNGNTVLLGYNELTSKCFINGMTDQQFKTDIEGKFNKTYTHPIEHLEPLLPSFLQNANPFIPHSATKDRELNFKQSSQSRYSSFEHTKDKVTKNSFDFMVETKRLLAALGNRHDCSNDHLEPLSQENPITLAESSKSDISTKDVSCFFHESNITTCNNNISETSACISELNESCWLEPRQNEGLDEIKSNENDVIGGSLGQNVDNDLKDQNAVNSSSPHMRNEDLWEYVLVNDNFKFTYKRSNPDPIQPTCGKESVLMRAHTSTVMTALPTTHKESVDQFRNESNGLSLSLDEMTYQNDVCTIDNSTSNDLPESNKSSEYADYQTRLDENDSMLQNCSISTKEKSSEDKSVCEASTDSKEITLINTTLSVINSIDNDIPVLDKLIDDNTILVECNKIPERSGKIDEDNYFSSKRELVSHNLDVEKIENISYQNYFNLCTPIPTKDIDVACENIKKSLDSPNSDNNENIGNNQSNFNSTCMIGETQASVENKISDNITIINQTYCDIDGMQVNEHTNDGLKTSENSSLHSLLAKHVNADVHDVKHYEKSDNEKCANVLEMMENILKSMAPLCETPSSVFSKNGTHNLNDLESKQFKSDEICLNTVSTSDQVNESSWIPNSIQSTQIPKPARNTSRKIFLESSFLSEPQEMPSSFKCWDTVSNPAEQWNQLTNVLDASKEKPVALPQRKKLSIKKLADSSTNTNYQDFSLITNDYSPGVKILVGRTRSINEGCFEFKSDILETLSLDKSTMTSGNLVDPGKCFDIVQICNLFPNIPKSYILDMVDRCHGDVNWAVDILLDSEHSIYEMSELNDGKEIAEDSVSSKENTESKLEFVNGHCNSSLNDETHSIPEENEIQHELKIMNVQEQSRIKKLLENSIVIGKSHYSEKVLKVLKKKHPEYVSMVESSQSPVEKKLDEYSNLINNVCKTETIVNNDASNEVMPEYVETENVDETFEVIVNSDIILQLQQKFGNSNCPDLANMMPVVKLPVSLARELYGYIMDSLQSDIEEQQDAIEQMISQDEEVARLMQYSDDLKPQLQEIMDMEVALEVHRADQAESNEKYKSTVAARLSQNILLEKFPHVDPKMLMEVFYAHNYSLHDTVASLQLALGVEGTNPKPIASTSKVQKEEGGFAEEIDLSQEAQAYRDQAANYYSLRTECLSKAHDAFRSNNKPVASYYSQLAQMHKNKMAHYNSQAAACLMSSHKKGNNTLDLHFLHVTEAKTVLDMFLDEIISNINEKKKSHQTVYIITGRGLRSVGGISRIKPMVLRTLSNRGILFNEVNPGMVSAFVRSTSFLSHYN